MTTKAMILSIFDKHGRLHNKRVSKKCLTSQTEVLKLSNKLFKEIELHNDHFWNEYRYATKVIPQSDAECLDDHCVEIKQELMDIINVVEHNYNNYDFEDINDRLEMIIYVDLKVIKEWFIFLEIPIHTAKIIKFKHKG